MMFRRTGKGELYAYFPQIDSNKEELAKIKPKVVENDTYGTSVGRGSFEWATNACECGTAILSACIIFTDNDPCFPLRDFHHPTYQAK